MLDQVFIENKTLELNIAPLQVIREFYEMETLHFLSRSPLSEKLIFYGGTALRLSYNSFRFSEDLDFWIRKPGSNDKKELSEVFKNITNANTGVTVEEVIDKRWTLFGLLHFNEKFLKHPFRIKIEINKKKNGIESENRLLSSPVSNKEVIFRTTTLNSLLKLKENAIKSRNVPRDYFDYWYIAHKLKIDINEIKNFPFNPKEFEREMKRWLPKDKWKIIGPIIKFYVAD